MRKRVPALVAALVVALTLTGSAVAFDCIRVSSSLQGLVQSTSNGGRWLLFDFSSANGVQQTFANVFEVEITAEQASCLADAYAQSGQPLYFALGIGVAGRNGVLAHNNPNDTTVLANGKGIDHIEDSPIVGALFAAAETCGVTIPDEG
jgi:hypothetical protein